MHMEHWWSSNDRANRCTWGKICCSATVPSVNPIWSGLELNPVLRDKMPVNNFLSNDTIHISAIPFFIFYSNRTPGVQNGHVPGYSLTKMLCFTLCISRASYVNLLPLPSGFNNSLRTLPERCGLLNYSLYIISFSRTVFFSVQSSLKYIGPK